MGPGFTAFLLGVFSSGTLVLLMSASVYSSLFHFWPPTSRNWKWAVYWILATNNMIAIALLLIAGLSPLTVNLNTITASGLIFLGLAISIKAIKELGLKRTSGLEGEFYKEGIYRFSRNPQVTGNLITLLGVASFLRTTEAFTVTLLTGFWLIAMVFSEEKWLYQKYGEKYLDYREQVPRFI